jgi:hypothetical protein
MPSIVSDMIVFGSPVDIPAAGENWVLRRFQTAQTTYVVELHIRGRYDLLGGTVVEKQVSSHLWSRSSATGTHSRAGLTGLHHLNPQRDREMAMGTNRIHR